MNEEEMTHPIVLRAVVRIEGPGDAFLLAPALAAELTRLGAADVMTGADHDDRIDVEIVAAGLPAAVRTLERARAAVCP